MKQLAVLFLALSLGAFAATNNVTASSRWKVWTTGSNNNGGCFDNSSAGGTGVDYSAQVGAQYTVTTGLTTAGAGSSTITQTGGTWLNDVLGNCIHITAGTNFVQGFYVVVGFTDSNNIILNVSPSPAGAGSVGTGKIGGAIADIATAETGVVAGNRVDIKATANYNVSSNITFSTNGASGSPITWEGYTTTPGDGGHAVILNNVPTGSLNMFTGGANFQRFRHLTLDCNAGATCRAFNNTGNNLIVEDIWAKGYTVAGFTPSGNQNIYRNNLASGGTSCTAGFWLTGAGNYLEANRATGNACPGFFDNVSSGTSIDVFVRNIADNNTGASSDGFQKGGTVGTLMVGNVAYTNGRDGFRFSAGGGLDMISVHNNISYANAGIQLNSVSTDWSAYAGKTDFDYNAVGLSGGGCAVAANCRTNVPAGAHDVTLSGDPFNGGGTNDFTLNGTAGAGASCKTAAFPGALQSGGTGSMDIGALQSAGSGGGTVTKACSIAN
jgi:hypothetical protein